MADSNTPRAAVESIRPTDEEIDAVIKSLSSTARYGPRKSHRDEATAVIRIVTALRAQLAEATKNKVDETWFACMSGDCPHETQAECDAQLRTSLIETTQENIKLRAQLAEASRDREQAKAERELLVDVVRLVGESHWDAPGWNLIVREDKAHLLFDIAYGYIKDSRPSDGLTATALRTRQKQLFAARALSPGEAAE